MPKWQTGPYNRRPSRTDLEDWMKRGSAAQGAPAAGEAVPDENWTAPGTGRAQWAPQAPMPAGTYSNPPLPTVLPSSNAPPRPMLDQKTAQDAQFYMKQGYQLPEDPETGLPITPENRPLWNRFMQESVEQPGAFVPRQGVRLWQAPAHLQGGPAAISEGPLYDKVWPKTEVPTYLTQQAQTDFNKAFAASRTHANFTNLQDYDTWFKTLIRKVPNAQWIGNDIMKNYYHQYMPENVKQEYKQTRETQTGNRAVQAQRTMLQQQGLNPEDYIVLPGANGSVSFEQKPGVQQAQELKQKMAQAEAQAKLKFDTQRQVDQMLQDKVLAFQSQQQANQVRKRLGLPVAPQPNFIVHDGKLVPIDRTPASQKFTPRGNAEFQANLTPAQQAKFAAEYDELAEMSRDQIEKKPELLARKKVLEDKYMLGGMRPFVIKQWARFKTSPEYSEYVKRTQEMGGQVLKPAFNNQSGKLVFVSPQQLRENPDVLSEITDEEIQ